MKKIFYVFLILLLSSVFLFFRIGYYLDITQKPVKSDIIACLGGGKKLIRIKESLKLYDEGYDKTGTLIITGGTSFTELNAMNDIRIKFVKTHNSSITVQYNPMTKNTAEEMIYIKSYMMKHHLKRVIIVSDPLYSRRIKMFAKIFDFAKNGIEICLVSSHPSWWNKDRYYQNVIARDMVFSELLKIPYNYIKYDILSNFGLVDYINKTEDKFHLRSKFYRVIKKNIENKG